MTAEQWKKGRESASMTQAEAAHSLGVSQPYLSQLEKGLRTAKAGLERKAVRLYGLSSDALPLPKSFEPQKVSPDKLQRELASLGYPGFEHVRFQKRSNPAEVVLSALVQEDLDTRLVEALPWVLATHYDLNWEWLRDRVKLKNAQNRLGYVLHLAEQTAQRMPVHQHAVEVLHRWSDDLEEARLAREATLCRESMPQAEREWVRSNRPPAAVHWGLLTSLAAEQLPYAS